MTNFPTTIDTDTEIPRIDDNLSEIGAQVINACRDAIFAIETYLGTTGNGTLTDISSRLDVSIEPDGTIKPSAISGLGLVTLPITNSEVSSSAAIDESKLNLNFTTTFLNNAIDLLKLRIVALENFYDTVGYKLQDHLNGTNYNHTLTDIHVDTNPVLHILNNLGVLRDTTTATLLIKDLNDDYVKHQKNNGIQSSPGVILPDYFSHTAGAIFVDSSRFNAIPESIDNLQKFSEFVDSNSLLLIGSRLQNLFENGISRASRSSIFELDGYAQNVVPVTPVITYLLNGSGATPVDDIYIGDDVIKFVPSTTDSNSGLFDSYFSKVKPGDIIRIDYGGIEIKYIIDSVKIRYVGLNKEFYVRINGKNLLDSTLGFARIDRPNYHDRKQGILSIAQANNELGLPSSLIVAHPRSASALGNGINLSSIDSSHYNLYLEFYPDGNPNNKVITLPGIDVTGNLGATPGLYTIDTIVNNTNEAFRKYGYNYRFIAYQYAGEFGIMLSEPYGGAGFAIIAGTVDTNGNYTSSSNLSYPNNIIDTYNSKDPLALGRGYANVAGPPFATSFSSSEQAIVSTKVHVPLKRNFFYLNGYELDLFATDVFQNIDSNGDGYWDGYVLSKTVLSDRVKITYEVLLNLSTSKLAKGKTITVLPTLSLTDSLYNFADYGRFTIESIDFDICNCDGYLTTRITVTDGVYGLGSSPNTVSDVGNNVKLYFSEDSVSFNYGHVSDGSSAANYKRLFETYITDKATIFNHERARFDASISNNDASISNNVFDFIDVSPKLRGYTSGLNSLIYLKTSYDSTTEIFTGYLCNYVGGVESKLGLKASGLKGETIRFYDESGIDYIDFKTDITSTISSYTNNFTQIQLFPSIQYDSELMVLGVCQYNDITKSVTNTKDKRQFGNISEKHLTTSALDFISAGDKYLHENGVVRGLELVGSNYQTVMPLINNTFDIKGGVALVNGKFINLNESKVYIPKYQLKYTNPGLTTSTDNNLNWYVCINYKGELVTILNADRGDGKYELYSPITLTSYEVNAVNFNDLVLKRKDLTPLYLVNITLNNSLAVTSGEVKDLRRFVNDSGANFELILTGSGNSNSYQSLGNFSNYIAVDTWLKNITQNNNTLNSNVVKVRGDVNVYLTDITYFGEVVFLGEKGSLTFTNDVEFTAYGNGFKFRDLTLNFNGTFNFHSKTIFENCFINTDTRLDSYFSEVGLYKTSFTGQYLPLTVSNIYSYESYIIINLLTIQDNIYINNTNLILQSTSPVLFNTFAVGTIQNSTLSISTNTKFTTPNVNLNNNDITINSPGRLEFVPSINNIFIENNKIYYVNSGASTNLNTTSNGLIYWDFNSSVNANNIKINNNTFTIVNLYHYPIINFRFRSLDTQSYGINGLQINNNIFTNQSADLTQINYQSDKQCVISICSDVASTSTTSTVAKPVLKNVEINNNYCNGNQSILLTQLKMKYNFAYCYLNPGIVANGIIISSNTCGAIGYWVTSDSTDTVLNNNGGLTISNNSCHYIANLASDGSFVLLFNNSKFVSYMSSGFVNILNNKCNWLHVGITNSRASETSGIKLPDAALNIDKNNIVAYNIAYLNEYAGFNTSNIGLIVTTNNIFSSVSGTENDDICTITNNTLLPDEVNSHYFTGTCALVTSSCKIDGNIIRGITNVNAITTLLQIGGYQTSITNNMFYRKKDVSNLGTDPTSEPLTNYIKYISSYDYGDVTDYPRGIITNNFFDEYYPATDTSVTSIIDVPRNFVVTQNINQSGYTHLLLNDGNYVYQNTGGSTYARIINRYVTATEDFFLESKDNKYLYIVDQSTNPSYKFTSAKEFNLNHLLPKGVRINQIKLGCCLNGANIPSSGTLYLTVKKSKAKSDLLNIATEISSGDNGNDTLVSQQQITLNATTLTNASTSYMTLNLDPSIFPYDYNSNDNYELFLEFMVFDFQQQADTLKTVIAVSPIQIDYRWI